MTRALLEPSPKTVWVAFFHNGQARHPAAAFRKLASVNRAGMRGAAVSWAAFPDRPVLSDALICGFDAGRVF